MWNVRRIRVTCSKSIRVVDGRNTIQGGRKAFWIAWPNIDHHIEDEAFSELDKKVEWYSDRHDNLTDDVRMAENKASAERDRHQKADEKLAQANSKITELEAKLAEL